MNLLTINAGSSSLKFKLFSKENDGFELKIKGKVEEIGEGETSTITFRNITTNEKIKRNSKIKNHDQALKEVLIFIDSSNITISGIGHRIVHGGAKLIEPVIITDSIINEIKSLIRFAPLHNPANLSGIIAASKLFPALPQVGVFDTSFHTTISENSYCYALPKEVRDNGFRRFGFHGISHEYITQKVARIEKTSIASVHLINAHLGNGASVCAIVNGKSVDTSMGFTPLEGLVMGTRCGDIDAGVVLALLDEYSSKDLDKLLNKKSGLLGLSSLDNNMKNIIENIEQDDCLLALNVFCLRLAKYIASYMVHMPQEFSLVFTAGIGENSSLVRKKTLENLSHFKYALDEDANVNASGDRLISPASSPRVYVLATNEEKLIAEKSYTLLNNIVKGS